VFVFARNETVVTRVHLACGQ